MVANEPVSKDKYSSDFTDENKDIIDIKQSPEPTLSITRSEKAPQ